MNGSEIRDIKNCIGIINLDENENRMGEEPL